ncbi:CynX/NimT family MFS transporter [Pseudogracilibacillus sp. ICA-222130]|uniref:CynX/NimT family MFS transporter n=1 Tax=Pseudogracilibacillus sp. ICA-222130 TaxID=3134655 RepID=UPI0030BD0640
MSNESLATKENKAAWLLLIGVMLVGTNLRVPLTSAGALITFIRDDLGMSNAVAGAITTLPLLAFAFLSPFAPKIANRIGMEWTIFLSLILLLIGTGVRSITGVGFLFTGTLFIGLAIAIGNVLIPAMIKMNFPLKIGLMTGIYAIFMNVFGALGSGLSVPISNMGDFGWKGALAFWGVLGIISLLLWIPQLKGANKSEQVQVKTQEKSNVWRSPLAWKITIFMGSQSLIYYTLITWMPDILISKNYSASMAGWIVFLMQFALIPCTFIIPVVSEKMKDQVLVSIATGVAFILGILGLMQGSAFVVPIAAILIGIGSGSAFSLSMMFFTLRTKDGKEAAEMSGMAQSFGYLLAATGPIIVGAIHDMTGGWTVPLCLLLITSIIIICNGMVAGKNGQVSDVMKKQHSVKMRV